MGRGLLFKLTQLALKVGSIDEAEECFEEFQKLAPQDSRQKLLRYQILKAKGAQPQQLIPPLEEYVNEEISEEWMYELAELYHKAGMRDACLDLCDRITILFGSGEWVQKALRLKAEGEGEPLNEYQQSIAGEIYYQPASSPRQNAVRETAPVTPAFSQSVPVIPEFSLQPQEAVPPVMTATATVPPFTAAPETVTAAHRSTGCRAAVHGERAVRQYGSSGSGGAAARSRNAAVCRRRSGRDSAAADGGTDGAGNPGGTESRAGDDRAVCGCAGGSLSQCADLPNGDSSDDRCAFLDGGRAAAGSARAERY